MTSKRKQAAVAAAVTFANIAVAVTVNVLTYGWSWLVFVALAVLSATWVGPEVWRAVPRTARHERLGAPAVPGAGGTFVPRPELTGRIMRSLLAARCSLLAGRSGKVGITTALAGAGGFGKTTLAREVCTLPAITAAFGTPLWATVGQEVHGAPLADLINDDFGGRPDHRPPLGAGRPIARHPPRQDHPVRGQRHVDRRQRVHRPRFPRRLDLRLLVAGRVAAGHRLPGPDLADQPARTRRPPRTAQTVPGRTRTEQPGNA